MTPTVRFGSRTVIARDQRLSSLPLTSTGFVDLGEGDVDPLLVVLPFPLRCR